VGANFRTTGKCTIGHSSCHFVTTHNHLRSHGFWPSPRFKRAIRRHNRWKRVRSCTPLSGKSIATSLLPGKSRRMAPNALRTACPRRPEERSEPQSNLIHVQRLAFPYNQDSPSEPLKLLPNLRVARYVSGKFALPRCTPRRRRCGPFAANMPMPEAAVNEHDFPPPREH
jgi:hypothetical protein